MSFWLYATVTRISHDEVHMKYTNISGQENQDCIQALIKTKVYFEPVNYCFFLYHFIQTFILCIKKKYIWNMDCKLVHLIGMYYVGSYIWYSHALKPLNFHLFTNYTTAAHIWQLWPYASANIWDAHKNLRYPPNKQLDNSRLTTTMNVKASRWATPAQRGASLGQYWNIFYLSFWN